MWKLMLIAGAGGFIGTSCRFLINRLFLVVWKAPFPLATFTINILGCFLFGILMGVFQRHLNLPDWINPFLVVGFCGGFTTFSTFSYEAFNLGTNGFPIISLLYMGASVILGLIAVWWGMTIMS